MAEATSRVPGFGGGLNLRDAPNQLAADQARVLEDILIDEQGGAAKRAGSTAVGTFGAGSERALSTYTFYRASASPTWIVNSDAGKLYYSTNLGVTWSTMATGLSLTAPMSYETFNSKCYMSNGVDDYASWDGTTFTTFPAAPKGKYLKVWKDTMWQLGITGLPDRTYSSAAGDAETWPIAGWVDIGKGDGDNGMALSSDGNYLIVFKLRRHWIVYDPVTFANRLVDYEKGCESHFSCIQFDGQVYFLSRRGICIFLGDSPAELISSNIDPLFNGLVINLNALKTSWAYAFDNRVGWALPEVGSNFPTFQIEFYPRLQKKPWSIQRLPARSFTSIRQATTELLYFTGANSNKALQAFAAVGTDDGVIFKGIAQTGWYDLGAPGKTKYIRRARVLGRGRFYMYLLKDFQNAIAKTFAVDLGANTDTWSLSDAWGVGTWGPESSLKEKLINVDLYCRYVAIRIEDTESSAGIKPLSVGSKDYALDAGEWAVYGALLHGTTVGVRS